MAGLVINPRSAWGFKGWAGSTPYGVSDRQRTEFFTHYEGGFPTRDTGAAAMRDIDAGHRANGWAGVGYNFVVMLDGSVWEGRGWALVGAHCPDHNRSGWGVQIHLGGAQAPTPAALAACRALYDEACARAGRTLAKLGHRDGYATECPGEALYAWVRAGMPAPTTPPPAPTLEDDMAQYVKTSTGAEGYLAVTPSGVHALTGPEWAVLQDDPAAKVQTVSPADWAALAKLADPKPTLTVDVATLVDQLAPELAARLSVMLPAGYDPQAIAAATLASLAERLAS